MQVNYTKLLTKFSGILGISGIILLAALPVRANQPIISDSVQVPLAAPERSPATDVPKSIPTPINTIPGKNLIESLETQGSFTTFVKALKIAGLTEVLTGTDSVTVFAPTDAAFAQLEKWDKNILNELFSPENKAVLVEVLTYHLVKGGIPTSNLKPGLLKTMQGEPIAVKFGNQGIIIEDARITKSEIQANNGVIHQINNVILPANL